MAKPYHPCYTDVNPAVEARKYTSEQVYYRKVTLMYDWLAPDRDVEGWSRRVPYRLERGQMEGSWVVKYFEFRAGIGPLIGVGFIGDLWISWNPEDPSVWFKVEEDKWERWGGCASSVRVEMNARHPFLDGAYLWFSPKDFFFLGKIPDVKLSLRWDRSSRIRRVAPITRIIDPDSCVLPKKIPKTLVYLPSMRAIVCTLCPNMSRLAMPAPPPTPTRPIADPKEGCGDGIGEVTVNTSRALRGPSPMEEMGDDVENIDWDWWGSTDGEVEDETTEVGSSQPQILGLTPTPSPVAPSKNSRYHPYQFNSSPATPYKKFKPPARYAKGALGQNTSTSDPCNTPVSSFPSSTPSTAVNPTTPAHRSTSSEPFNPGFTDDDEQMVDDIQGQEMVLPKDEPAYPRKPSQRTLKEIVRILREDGHDQSGVWALPPPEFYDAVGDLAAELPVPVLELKRQTSYEVGRLLRRDGFTQNGILILKMHNPSDDENIHDQIVKEDILAWI